MKKLTTVLVLIGTSALCATHNTPLPIIAYAALGHQIAHPANPVIIENNQEDHAEQQKKTAKQQEQKARKQQMFMQLKTKNNHQNHHNDIKKITQPDKNKKRK